jgi:hypothetical protein
MRQDNAFRARISSNSGLVPGKGEALHVRGNSTGILRAVLQAAGQVNLCQAAYFLDIQSAPHLATTATGGIDEIGIRATDTAT